MFRYRHQFKAARLRNQPLYDNGTICLVPKGFYRVPYSHDLCDVYIFNICLTESRKPIGEIALRMGEGDGLYYLGHIGYHIDPPYRGNHYALVACRLTLDVFRQYHMSSFSITTDPDNWASIKTCLELGCVLESVTDVPEWYVR